MKVATLDFKIIRPRTSCRIATWQVAMQAIYMASLYRDRMKNHHGTVCKVDRYNAEAEAEEETMEEKCLATYGRRVISWLLWITSSSCLLQA